VGGDPAPAATPTRTGRPRSDDRALLNGILYVLSTGCRWSDMPRAYGAPETAWRRHKEWQTHRVWERALQALLDQGGWAGTVDAQAVAIEATTIEAKKGARRSGATASAARQGARSTSS
jgi:transposase